MDNPERHLDERAVILNYAHRNNIQLTDDTNDKLYSKLENIALEYGYETAIRYITGLSVGEKELMIRWVANGYVSINKLSNLYPQLYNYMEKSCGTSDVHQKWVLDYIDAYKQAKLTNRYTSFISTSIDEKC